ncbi:hypothetical protein K437DRAFT_67831 [Tilletiaria anomala UBC 951]|uniref:Uncharacterized protein n=1 Tax=Tilletiaria anomala (strain ATCC 24038 / CBS 436.72 / UBC 951) TaxID=1037660 RepID=A0A066V6B3_TILAU|nr:uncharacterized protein K437DRAFT_67831 [Tilletiaria anomala UBC 951]KDN35783.1 hypothetical protein K437DRAFT_67831 [Tilletiaria anomala UBC 951]
MENNDANESQGSGRRTRRKPTGSMPACSEVASAGDKRQGSDDHAAESSASDSRRMVTTPPPSRRRFSLPAGPPPAPSAGQGRSPAHHPGRGSRLGGPPWASSSVLPSKAMVPTPFVVGGSGSRSSRRSQSAQCRLPGQPNSRHLSQEPIPPYPTSQPGSRGLIASHRPYSRSPLISTGRPSRRSSSFQDLPPPPSSSSIATVPIAGLIHNGVPGPPMLRPVTQPASSISSLEITSVSNTEPSPHPRASTTPRPPAASNFDNR